MPKNFVIFCVLFVTVSCQNHAPTQVKHNEHNEQVQEELKPTQNVLKKSCVCPMHYLPVCDEHGNKTYSNSCVAECNQIKDYRMGACEDTNFNKKS